LCDAWCFEVDCAGWLNWTPKQMGEAWYITVTSFDFATQEGGRIWTGFSQSQTQDIWHGSPLPYLSPLGPSPLKNLLILEIAKVSLEECDSYMIVVRLRCFFQPLNTDIVLYLTCSNTLSATNPTWTEVVISKKIYSKFDPSCFFLSLHSDCVLHLCTNCRTRSVCGKNKNA
jgi:hypothetical protein